MFIQSYCVLLIFKPEVEFLLALVNVEEERNLKLADVEVEFETTLDSKAVRPKFAVVLSKDG